ncbi:MAG: ASCH domain-containing protein [Xenococcaceae cyanobacterium MO_188.B19]|nr:ASCH domain-containing protein [Xenococcaceae cyanobacterium MO_188.B19]
MTLGTNNITIIKNKVLLLSIKPKYVTQIFSGKKTVELRRVKTKLKPGDLVIVYSTSPQKALTGFFEVDKVLRDENLDSFWQKVKDYARVNHETFQDYYRGAALAVGIFIKNYHQFSKPVSLETLKSNIPGFHPPQNYHYLDDEKVNILESLTGESIK